LNDADIENFGRMFSIFSIRGMQFVGLLTEQPTLT